MGWIKDGTGPFTRRFAFEQDIGPEQIERSVATARWFRLRNGIYVTANDRAAAKASDPTLHAQDVRALELAMSRRNLAAAGTSAARIHGLELLQAPPPELIVVTDDPGVAGTHRDGYFLRVAPLPAEHVTHRHGMRVTTPARTVVDIAAHRGVDEGVVAAESAYRKKLLTPARLRELVDRTEGRPGILRVRDMLALATPGTESVLESMSMLNMRRIGVQLPLVQVTLFLGSLEFRVDFLWPHIRLVGEGDGEKKYSLDGRSPMAALREERQREQAIRDLGYDIVRWDFHVANNLDRFAARLNGAFARATARMQGRTG